jgi:hypothetical protein
MIYGNKEKWASFSAREMAEAIERHEVFNKKYYDIGELLASYGLADADAAKRVRVKDGTPVVTDGPYLEAKEYLASFWLLDCESEARALEIAAELPSAAMHDVEVWPVPHESPHAPR